MLLLDEQLIENLKATLKKGLLHLYDAEEEKDYAKRNRFVIHCLTLAQALGYNAGIKIDLNEPEWPVVLIDLPTGQVSWHLPQYDGAWDGHTTEEKYQRINEYLVGRP